MKALADRSAFLVVLLMSLAAPPLAAQQSQTGDDTQQLEAIEVIGSRIKRACTEGQTPVQTLTREELENRVRIDLADCLRRLSDSDRNIAEFYERVGNGLGARRHALRAIEEARQAGDQGRVAETENLLRDLPPEAGAPAAASGGGP